MLLHVLDIVQILIDECSELEGRAAPALTEGKGIKFPSKFQGYPQAIVSSLAVDFKDAVSVSAGFPSIEKQINAPFEILLRFDANINLNAALVDAALDKVKSNVMIVDDTICKVVNILQARQIRVLGALAYINITDVYVVQQESVGVTKVDVAYAIAGEASFKYSFKSNLFNDKYQIKGVKIDGVLVKERII